MASNDPSRKGTFTQLACCSRPRIIILGGRPLPANSFISFGCVQLGRGTRRHRYYHEASSKKRQYTRKSEDQEAYCEAEGGQ